MSLSDIDHACIAVTLRTLARSLALLVLLVSGSVVIVLVVIVVILVAIVALVVSAIFWVVRLGGVRIVVATKCMLVTVVEEDIDCTYSSS